nr:hypothetical protein [Tanacetum cinerariifolium]
MAKLIRNNRILFNDNIFPHEEASMKLLDDSRTINEMLKQREQVANLAVQQEQEEQADYEEMLQDREKNSCKTHKPFWKKPEEIPELTCKLRKDVRNIRKELAEYINSPSWNSPTFFYDKDEEYSIQYKEYLEKFPDAVTTVLPTEEPEYSLSMGYEHLSTIPETESDEVTKSSAKNLLPILSEYEVTSDDESECDVPIKDESSSVFTSFSNPLFNDNDDFTFSDDEFPDEDVPIEEFKVYSNPLFDDEEINSGEINPHYFNAESDFVESLSNSDTLIDSSPKFDYLEEFSGALMPTSISDEERIRREHAEYISLMERFFTINPCPRLMENCNTIVETLPSSPIPLQDSDSQREEIGIFTSTDELLPPSIESGYDSEGEIYVPEELLIDDSIPIPENESSNSDHQDDP